MKRWISLLLVICMLGVIRSGCGSADADSAGAASDSAVAEVSMERAGSTEAASTEPEPKLETAAEEEAEEAANLLADITTYVSEAVPGFIMGTKSLDVDYLGNPALFGVHSNNLPINGLDRLREINKLTFGCADYGAHGIWGYPVDRTDTRQDTGLSYHVGSIYRKDKAAPIMQLVTFEGAGHAHSSFYATLCWDFMSQFARDERGVILVIRNHYPRDPIEKEVPN